MLHVKEVLVSFFFMFMGVFRYMYVCVPVCVWWQHEPEEGIEAPGDRITDDCKLLCVLAMKSPSSGRVYMLLIELPFQLVKAILRLRDNLRIGLSHILWYLLSKGIIPHLNYFIESFLDHFSAMWKVSGIEEVKCSLTDELSKHIFKDMALRAK